MKNEGEAPEPSEGWPSEIKNWIHDNVRIVLSIVIVLAIALGVYSYSKRGAEETEENLAEETSEEVNIEEIIEGKTDEEEADSEEITEIEEFTEEEVATEEVATEEVATEEVATEEVATEEVATEEVATETTPQQEETIISQDGGSYEVTAAKGDSLTTLARSAIKQYLDNHNDPSITAEHKVYMEDYLAKKMGYSSQLNIGEKKTFSENDIELALKDAKTLTSNQLENLKVFSQQVPGL
jgi:hypothetical protein